LKELLNLFIIKSIVAMKNFLCGDIFVLNKETVIQEIESRLQKMWMKYIYHAYDYKIVLFYFLGHTEKLVAWDFYDILKDGIENEIERVNLSMNIENNNNIEILAGNWEKINKDDKFISIDISPTYSFEFIQDKVLKNIVGNSDYKLIVKRDSLEDKHLWKNLIRLDVIF